MKYKIPLFICLVSTEQSHALTNLISHLTDTSSLDTERSKAKYYNDFVHEEQISLSMTSLSIHWY